MKHFFTGLIAILFTICLCGCSTTVGKDDGAIDDPFDNEIIEDEFDLTKINQLLVKIGDNSFAIQLENTPTTKALKEWLKKEEKTVSASNYGGFEKILSLGQSFPTDNEQITTSYGDVMLYNGNQIVIFYESNFWSYTRIGKVIGEKDLFSILSGNEKEAKISLVRDEL